MGKGYTGDHGENLNGGVSSSTFMACVHEVLRSFPENNKPPKADAGPDKELTLPYLGAPWKTLGSLGMKMVLAMVL